MSDCDYIEDGYTEKGSLDAEAGIHGAIQFEYRPMMPVAQGRLLDTKGEAFIPAVAKALCGKEGSLKSWSLVDSKKQPVPVSEANILRIKPRLFDKLWQVVAGIRPSDGGKPLDLEADGKN